MKKATKYIMRGINRNTLNSIKRNNRKFIKNSKNSNKLKMTMKIQATMRMTTIFSRKEGIERGSISENIELDFIPLYYHISMLI